MYHADCAIKYTAPSDPAISVDVKVSITLPTTEWLNLNVPLRRKQQVAAIGTC